MFEVKKALKSAFNVVIEEETTRELRGRIVRFARLYGFPVIWPGATIELWIDRNSEKIFYTFYWPDYYMLVGYFIVLPVFLFEVNLSWKEMLFFIPVILFNFLCINFDTRYVQSRVRKFLMKTQSLD
jgi:hypothetical protein